MDTKQSPTPRSPEEFQSVVLTVDHTTHRKDQHVVQKFVASTQTLTEAMIALLAYYDESHYLHSPMTIEQFQLAAMNTTSAFVYRTPENVQIVLDADTFETLVAVQGTVLATVSYILDAAGRLITDMEEAANGVVPLLLLSFTLEDSPEQEGDVLAPEQAE